MMFFLSKTISVFIPILKVGHFSCLFTRYVSIMAIHNKYFLSIHCMFKHKNVFTLLCTLNIYIIRHLFPTDNRDRKGCHQNLYCLS